MRPAPAAVVMACVLAFLVLAAGVLLLFPWFLPFFSWIVDFVGVIPRRVAWGVVVAVLFVQAARTVRSWKKEAGAHKGGRVPSRVPPGTVEQLRLFLAEAGSSGYSRDKVFQHLRALVIDVISLREGVSERKAEEMFARRTWTVDKELLEWTARNQLREWPSRRRRRNDTGYWIEVQTFLARIMAQGAGSENPVEESPHGT